MASVWKRSNSRFLTACFRDQNGRQRRISTKENRPEKGAKARGRIREGFKDKAEFEGRTSGIGGARSSAARGGESAGRGGISQGSVILSLSRPRTARQNGGLQSPKPSLLIQCSKTRATTVSDSNLSTVELN